MALIDYKNVEILRRDYLVLKDVSFKVNEGELVYIVGKVGSVSYTHLTLPTICSV